MSLGHVDITRMPPVVRQDPNSVDTKFAKAIVTYFFRLGDDLTAIVTDSQTGPGLSDIAGDFPVDATGVIVRYCARWTPPPAPPPAPVHEPAAADRPRRSSRPANAP
jgi:hypothetical protein